MIISNPWYSYIRYLYHTNLKKFYLEIIDMDRKDVLEIIK